MKKISIRISLIIAALACTFLFRPEIQAQEKIPGAQGEEVLRTRDEERKRAEEMGRADEIEPAQAGQEADLMLQAGGCTIATPASDDGRFVIYGAVWGAAALALAWRKRKTA